MLQRSNWSFYNITAVKLFNVSLIDTSRKIDETESIESFRIIISRPDTHNGGNCLEEALCNKSTNSTDDDIQTTDKTKDEQAASDKFKKDNKGFRPKSSFKWNMGEETFDLLENDALFEKKLGRDLIRQPMRVIITKQAKIIDFFSNNSISETLRKELWRTKIGNKLKITRAFYNNLVDRLANEPIANKAEKTIIDDLDRTFPECDDLEEGKQMYQDMRLVLSLFEVGLVYI